MAFSLRAADVIQGAQAYCYYFKVVRRSCIEAVAWRYGLNMEVSADAASEGRRTAMEQALFSLWCDVLKRDHIGLDDDFFMLGGDSLLAVDLLVRVEQAFQVKLPLQYLLEAATVRQMAQFIQHYSSGDLKDIVGLQTSGSMRPLLGWQAALVIRCA